MQTELKTEEREIDGLVVTTTQLPPMRALVLSKRLLPIFAPLVPILAAAAGAAAAAGDDEAAFAAAIAKVEFDLDELGEALAKLTDEQLVQLWLKTFASTHVKLEDGFCTLNSEDRINKAFAGRFFTMLRAFRFVVEVNFFPGGRGEDNTPRASVPTPKAKP